MVTRLDVAVARAAWEKAFESESPAPAGLDARTQPCPGPLERSSSRRYLDMKRGLTVDQAMLPMRNRVSNSGVYRGRGQDAEESS